MCAPDRRCSVGASPPAARERGATSGWRARGRHGKFRAARALGSRPAVCDVGRRGLLDWAATRDAGGADPGDGTGSGRMVGVFGLEGTPSLVVGGASGIGRATALLLGAVGASVAVADLDAERAATVAAEISAAGGSAVSLGGDVLEPTRATAVVDGAYEALGGLEVVVNIVGFAAWSTLLDYDLDTWDHDFRRNLDQHLFVGQAAARRFIADGVAGRIAMVASVSGIYGAPNHAAYG